MREFLTYSFADPFRLPFSSIPAINLHQLPLKVKGKGNISTVFCLFAAILIFVMNDRRVDRGIAKEGGDAFV